MENSGKPFFAGDAVPHWFISIGEASLGPMTSSEVYARITSGEISWADHVWREGQEGWQRICDVPAFQVAVPQAPTVTPTKGQPPAAPRVPSAAKEWFLFYNDTQYGPFTADEVKGMFRSRRASDDAFVWKDGMADWEKAAGHSLFQNSIPERTPINPGSEVAEKRAFIRKPLIAKVMIADHARVVVGICRDVSVGGMQVLTEFVPERAGVRLKLNISPPDLAHPSFPPFVAEGVVVRILDGQLGFSFRFENLPESALVIIERIVSQS